MTANLSRRQILAGTAASAFAALAPRAAAAQGSAPANDGPATAVVAGLAPPANHVAALNLVLCMDVSQSIDDEEYLRQLHGTANALESREVLNAILGQYGGVNVTCVQFAGLGRQTLGWAHLNSEDAVLRYAEMIRQTPRYALQNGLTQITSGIDASLRTLQGAFPAERQVVDLSGDGTNDGHSAYGDMMERDEHAGGLMLKNAVEALARRTGATVNGLAICNEVPDLDDYFRNYLATPFGEYTHKTEAGYDEVVPGGRVWRVDNMADFKEVMIRKLSLEIAQNGALPPPAIRNAPAANGPSPT